MCCIKYKCCITHTNVIAVQKVPQGPTICVLPRAKLGHTMQLQPGKSSPEFQIRGCSKPLKGEGVKPASTRLGGAGSEDKEGPGHREREGWGGGQGPPARRTTSAFFRAALRFCRMWRGWFRPSSPRAIPPKKQGIPRVSMAAL